ncbi:hypothetical protein Tco_0629415 [Tanacetum coccineum]|uniref:Uncharacterized protein n=1 Tax=Tanacetum coccineum TaxID=301880 RepID=A0ABQ4WT72_9ASTR
MEGNNLTLVVFVFKEILLTAFGSYRFRTWGKVVVDEEYPKGYFNLRPHLNDETTIMVNGKKKTIGSMVHAGLRKDFQDRYSDNKFKFKRRHFTKQPTVKDARDNKPSRCTPPNLDGYRLTYEDGSTSQIMHDDDLDGDDFACIRVFDLRGYR